MIVYSDKNQSTTSHERYHGESSYVTDDCNIPENVDPMITVTNVESPETIVDPQSFMYSGGAIYEDNFSDSYIAFMTSKFIKRIQKELTDWLADFDSNIDTVYIVNIRREVSKYSRYFFLRDENRKLVGLISLIFREDFWKTITQGKLSLFIRELNRFKDGNIDSRNLETFSKQLYRNAIGFYGQN